jgi:hypothetical protein
MNTQLIYKVLITSIIIFLVVLRAISQNPVWPVSNNEPNYNQINCTFAEKHFQFHGALDLNTSNGTIFLSPLAGLVKNNASSSNFFIAHHEILDPNDIETNLKVSRFGDYTAPYNNINNNSPINQGQQIGIQTTARNHHLHFEMWQRFCTNGCDWYRVNPLMNYNANYLNQPLGYNDTYDVEVNDVILEPVTQPTGISSGLVYTAGNGLNAFHFNTLKMHFKNRPGSNGTTYSNAYVGVFGSIMPTYHVRDLLVTSGVNSVGDGLGIYKGAYYINNEIKYLVEFDELEDDLHDEWETYFDHRFNTATGRSVLYGNNDYIKLRRIQGDVIGHPHKLIGQNAIPSNGVWATRNNKTSEKIFGLTPNQTTDIPINALYNDGKHHLDFSVFDAASNRDDASFDVVVDNFQPFITQVKLTSNGLNVLTHTRSQSEGTASLNNGKIKIEGETRNSLSFIQFGSNVLTVKTSEPTQNVKVQWKLTGPNVYSALQDMTPSSDKQTWTLTLPSNLAINCYDFKFVGTDLSNNTIMNVYAMTNRIILGDLPRYLCQNCLKSVALHKIYYKNGCIYNQHIKSKFHTIFALE